MFFLMLIAVVAGYVIGYIPAYITGELFLHLFKNKLADADLYKVIIYGGGISLLWIPISLLMSQFFQEWLMTFLYLQFVFILPITIICSIIEWKNHNKI